MTVREVQAMQLQDLADLFPKGPLAALGQGDDTVLISFPLPHHDLMALEIDVLHAKAAAFQDPQPGPIHQFSHEAMGASHSV